MLFYAQWPMPTPLSRRVCTAEQISMLRSCFDHIACIGSAIGNGCILSRIFAGFLFDE
jgi:hypothetical protein